ncbi:hypothetical protein [Natronorubrum daqingense]|uniref:Uncharacterized protein n=1 Tax=Natronorubrum daqingense TaxID=588898 RepID=A0A1N7G5H2_9EURY|nr:hypothetical protein [Natronorubrum daqingense]SIS07798.1 hypothetical protein SAMN05421809_3742 [Natronorubrum daqingense]
MPSQRTMRTAKIQKLPYQECPICGEELHGGYKASTWRRHRRQHYDWGEKL